MKNSPKKPSKENKLNSIGVLNAYNKIRKSKIPDNSDAVIEAAIDLAWSEAFRRPNVPTPANFPAEIVPEDEIQLEQMKDQWQYVWETKILELKFAASFNQMGLMQRLLSEHPEFINNPEILVTACFYGHLSMVKLLVEVYHFNVNKEYTFPGHETALQAAVSRASTDVVAFLIEHGANVNYKKAYLAESPLEICLKSVKRDFLTKKLNIEYLPILKLLVDAGVAFPNQAQVNQIMARFKKGDTQLLEKMRALLSADQPTITELRQLMRASHLQDDAMDSLLIVFSKISLEQAGNRLRPR